MLFFCLFQCFEEKGDAGLQPLNNGKIILEPSGIGRGRWCVAGDVMEERTAAKMDLEEMPPIIVVVAVEIKNNGDERSDVSDRIAEGESGGNGRLDDWGRRCGLADGEGKSRLAAAVWR